mmetsp:Transcript_29576/g.53178  ORF Transcript_29576/g.53178 Transcript_29576/m.53178 type:complete len:85 (-) Transcript_29576:1374-1628(-)
MVCKFCLVGTIWGLGNLSELWSTFLGHPSLAWVAGLNLLEQHCIPALGSPNTQQKESTFSGFHGTWDHLDPWNMLIHAYERKAT